MMRQWIIEKIYCMLLDVCTSLYSVLLLAAQTSSLTVHFQVAHYLKLGSNLLLLLLMVLRWWWWVVVEVEEEVLLLWLLLLLL